MDQAASESLLAQILIIVQEIQVSTESFEKRLDEARKSIEAINLRIDTVIETGFPKGDLVSHRQWHEEKDLPAWKRIVLNLILK
ncbi:hypothetical protein [Xanthomonas phage BUDD]|nr:hypothetical protein [Xanthomonas phage BUDD]